MKPHPINSMQFQVVQFLVGNTRMHQAQASTDGMTWFAVAQTRTYADDAIADAQRLFAITQELPQQGRCIWSIGRKYIDTGKTGGDWDEMLARQSELESALGELISQCKSGDDITAWWKAAVERAEVVLKNKTDRHLVSNKPIPL